MKSLFEILGGFALLIFGIALLKYVIKEARKGYRDSFGNDIGLCFSALGAIFLGIVFIYKGVFD